MVVNNKYQTEFSINMFGCLCVLAQQDGLEELDQSVLGKEYPFHIYMITRRPRIMIDPESVSFDGDLIHGQFLIQEGKNFTAERFTYRNYVGPNVRFECPFPYTEYFLYDKKNVVVSSGKTAYIMQNMNEDYSKYLDLEILYIGQSYGLEGARSASQRLQKHSTLQGIYAEAIRKAPDKEIWLVLWCFTPLVMVGIDGRSKHFVKTNDENNHHIERFYRNSISEQQLINYTEAALIKYFEPEYNQTYKNTFPNPAHKTYSECYDLDIHSLNVELQTEEIKCRLYAPKVAANWVQIASFNLHNPQERKSILDVALPDE